MLVEEHVIALSCLSRPRVPSVAQTHSVRELKQPRRRRQREWQKAMGLDWQNNNFALASRFFVYFLSVVARLQSESASFHVLSRSGTQNNNFRIQLQKRCQHLTN